MYFYDYVMFTLNFRDGQDAEERLVVRIDAFEFHADSEAIFAVRIGIRKEAIRS